MEHKGSTTSHISRRQLLQYSGIAIGASIMTHTIPSSIPMVKAQAVATSAVNQQHIIGYVVSTEQWPAQNLLLSHSESTQLE
jgi:hypothetical protein